MLDYEILRLIWWAILGVLLIGFAILDGFDLGVGMLLPVIGRKDVERRIMINTVGPVWEGNQVWLILGAGASFAAWPYLYAISFSGFYVAIFLALFGVILRPVGFKFRSKIENPTWRSFWDMMLFLGGFVPSLVFGVAFGNLFLGVPYHFSDELRIVYTGSFFDLFHPFALLTGLLSVVMFVFQGSNYLAVKTEAPLADRASIISFCSGFIFLILITLGGWMVYSMDGFALEHFEGVSGPSNPLHKTVMVVSGQWLHNFDKHTILWGVVGAVYLSIALALVVQKLKKPVLAFIFSSLSIASTLTMAGLSLYPFLMPSSINPNHSLTVWDASSSERTLKIMLLAVVVFLPFVLAYTAWIYRVMRGKVTSADIEANSNAY
ncbi:MAG: cytochrome d ubiquinol oxidase subunit II [Candidatus Nucleicultricaceae bacterium]|jgi:cytochrome d ubiquinol oxidase subunit II